MDASSASVIEAVRLAEALAALRDLHAAGLAELTEAAPVGALRRRACPMRSSATDLEIGERLGEVPQDTPVVPLQRDLAAQQRATLRLSPPRHEPLDLDLRNQTDRARSQLLHRCACSTSPGASPARPAGTGTFHEHWQLQWQPEYAVR